MSLHFNWSKWDQTELTQQLLTTLNSLLSDLPPNDQLVGTVRMTDFSFGTSAPQIELFSVNELSLTVQEVEIKFRYEGDGYAKIETMAQINKIASQATVSSSFLSDVSIQSPMVMPVKVHAHGLVVDGHVRIRVTRKSEMDFDEAVVSIRLLHQNPLKQIIISTNFEEDMPDTKDIFDSQVRDGVGQLVKDLMENDKIIPIRLKKKNDAAV